jgi:hypothetical protein
MRQLLEMLLGDDLKRQLRLRQMTNEELFKSYEAELVNRHQSDKAFKANLGGIEFNAVDIAQ